MHVLKDVINAMGKKKKRGDCKRGSITFLRRALGETLPKI